MTSKIIKQTSFEVFRYQLVVDKMMQVNLFDNNLTAEQIREKKNDFFQDIITNDNFRFHSGNSVLNTKLVHKSGTMSYFRVGVARKKVVHKKDFTEDFIEDYPNVIVAINNDPTVQKIAIQTNTNAFQDCKTVKQIIQKTIANNIRKHNISLIIEPLYDKKEFWSLVQQYPKQIKQVSFDLISPNMSNISKDVNVNFNLKQLNEDTNTKRTKLEINADDESYLEIKEASDYVNSLVNYSANGGGKISMRVQGVSKKLHTAQSPSDFNIDEKLIKANDWDKLDIMFKDILI